MKKESELYRDPDGLGEYNLKNGTRGQYAGGETSETRTHVGAYVTL